jgi:hypothetical protein
MTRLAHRGQTDRVAYWGKSGHRSALALNGPGANDLGCVKTLSEVGAQQKNPTRDYGHA